MLSITRSNRFVKDLKLAIKRGFDVQKLNEVVSVLASQKKLDSKYNDHPLLGNYSDLFK